LQPISQVPPRTIPQKQVQESQQRLLDQSGQPQTLALDWLEGRGFTHKMMAHNHLGLESYRITPDENQPNYRETYWAIALHIPAGQAGQFYRKLRIAPWLMGEDRPNYLPRWSQYGVPVTIFYTYRPDNLGATWFCEGEWDAIRLGWLAKQLQVDIAVCCSTAGCGTVPCQDDLDQLPGEVTIFFDRNDKPTKNGTVPGEEGARKLALALGGRGRVALVPMPEGCEVNGWDVSNALDAGFGWADFEAAAQHTVAPVLLQEKVQSVSLGLRDRILTLLQRHETPFERELALMELVQEIGYPYRAVASLAKSLLTEEEQQLNQIETDRKLTALLQNRCTHLELNRYVESWFAEILLTTAAAMGTAPEFLFTTLIPAAASCIGTNAQVVIKSSAKYTQPMVFWTGIVANSGSMKTPAQRVILDPLVALEKDAYESYQMELADYRVAIESQRGKKQDNTEKAPALPIRKRYLTKDSTLETFQRLHAENPRGILYYRDELAGLIKVRNQYRGGHGADEEAELDQWVGSAIIVDRAEKSICLPCSAISRTGAIQWEVLADLMGDHQDNNGAWSRWLFCAVDTPPRYLQLLQEDQDTGVSEALTYLYTELEKVPKQDYLLSFEAKRLFEPWQHHLVDAQQSEDAMGLQLVYPKIEAYTARLALLLHIVNAVLRREKPSQMIDGETMKKAIELAAYYLWQHRLIHAHNSPNSGLTAISLKIQKFAERIGEVTASRLKSGIRALRKMATDQIRQLMETLASAGYGSVQGEGTEMTYIAKPSGQQPQLGFSPSLTSEVIEAIDPIDTTKTTMSIAEIQIQQEQQHSIDAIDVAEQSNGKTIQQPDEQLLNSASDLLALENLSNINTASTTAEIEVTAAASDVSAPTNLQPYALNSFSAERL